MATIKGVLNFPNVFTAKVPKAGGDPKFGTGVLMPANDPQVAGLLAEVAAAKSNSFPSGYSGTNCCFDLYENKIPPSKDYHDPRFVGWYLFTCTAKADDRPAVVDVNRQPVIDPGKLFAGQMVYVSAGITGYVQGTGGIGGWLNGVMLTDEEPPMGRLDNKPSVDQMFASLPGGAGPQTVPPSTPVPPAPNAAPAEAALVMTAAANGVTLKQYMDTPGWTEQMLIDQGLATRPVATAPTPPVPPAPAAPAAPVALTMTAAANGVTYEQYMATPGWTDQMLLDQGLAIKPSFA